MNRSFLTKPKISNVVKKISKNISKVSMPFINIKTTKRRFVSMKKLDNQKNTSIYKIESIKFVGKLTNHVKLIDNDFLKSNGNVQLFQLLNNNDYSKKNKRKLQQRPLSSSQRKRKVQLEKRKNKTNHRHLLLSLSFFFMHISILLFQC